jgi:thymidylate synthase (FAD)
MEILRQFSQIIPHGTIEDIELAGRTAYKSEDKITKGSAEDFVRNIIKRSHESVLEHFPLVFHLPAFQVASHIEGSLLEIAKETVGMHFTHTEDELIISMNVRTLRDAKRRVGNVLTNILVTHVNRTYPIFFEDLETWAGATFNITTPSETYLIASLPKNEAEKHIYRSVRLVTDRGVTHEWVRHRLPAQTQESTRYCNYAKKGVTFIKPVFWSYGEIAYNRWEIAMQQCEVAYNDLISCGCSPQEARSVLPNSLKTEIVTTTNIREWNHIFSLRTSAAAHPQMRELIIPLREKMKLDLPDLIV